MSSAVALVAADTLVFRDGRPFNQDDEGGAVVTSLFPPPPDALYGAIRVASAMALGWSGRGDWARSTNWVPEARRGFGEHIRVLGAGHTDDRSAIPNDIDVNGTLSVAGPFVRQTLSSGTSRLLVPAPANLRRTAARPGYEDLAVEKLIRLSPRKIADNATCDIDDCAYLLASTSRDYEVEKDPDGAWVDLHTLAFALGVSEEPGHVLPAEAIQKPEQRIGLARDDDSRLAIDGNLYQLARRRMEPGFDLCCFLEGVKSVPRYPKAVPLGSENRFVHVEPAGDELQMPVQPHVGTLEGRYALVFLTPAVLEISQMGPGLLAPGVTIPGFEGTLATAAIRRLQLRGGFAVRSRSGRAPQSTVIPAGSVLYFENGEPPLREGEPAGALGMDAQIGYGRYLVGVW